VWMMSSGLLAVAYRVEHCILRRRRTAIFRMPAPVFAFGWSEGRVSIAVVLPEIKPRVWVVGLGIDAGCDNRGPDAAVRSCSTQSSA
jgi:hypothetical protein